MNREVEVVVVGGGQSGIAVSEHLGSERIEHLVLERERVAEQWHTQRWDSLVANGPAWHDCFPGLKFEDVDPDSYATKDQVAAYFEAYAKKILAPIETGVEVTKVRRNRGGRRRFRIDTTSGVVHADFVVVATGPFQRPSIPDIVPEGAVEMQLHSSAYRNPSQLPVGSVLVVGAGSSGVQIADELQRSGRRVFLAVGAHDRPPRRYRGRDVGWWLGVLGLWDEERPAPGREQMTPAISGAHGGHTVDFRELAAQGVELVGPAHAFEDGTLHFRDELAVHVRNGDEAMLAMLDLADDYVERWGLNLPPEPEARKIGPDPQCLTSPRLSVDLAVEQVSSIVWATGFTTDYEWLDVDAVDERRQPQHRRGVSNEAGVYFVGLPWLSRRASTFIFGCWHDARFVVSHIASQRGYLAHQDWR